MKQAAQTLDVVQRVFAKREQERAIRLREFQRQLDEAKEVLTQLRAYRDQYLATSTKETATTTSLLLNQQAFLNKLNDAIAQQEQVIARARLERDELRRQWLKQRCRTESVSNLRQERERAEQENERQLEQKNLDEISLRAHGQPRH